MITCYCGVEDSDDADVIVSDPYSSYGPYEYVIPGGGNSPPYDVSSSAAGNIGPASYTAYGDFVATDEKTGDSNSWEISTPVDVVPSD
jgi:hypothetical protein